LVRLLPWALLLAAPVFSQLPPAADPVVKEGAIQWFTLAETRSEVAKQLGPPSLAAEFGKDFLSWQYRIGNVDHEEFSHQVVFRRSDGKLVSITRNYEEERNVDALFPDAETTVHSYPDEKKPEFRLRLRRLSGGRVLMAMGSAQKGKLTGQLVLMRESELPVFYPWLAQQLAAK